MKWKFVASNVWCVMANAMNYNEHEQLNRNKWNTQRFRLRTYYTEIKKKKKSSNQMNSNDRQGQRQCNGTIIWYLLFSSTLGCSIVWLFNKHVLADCNDYHHSTKMVSEIIDSGYLPYWTYFVVCHIFFCLRRVDDWSNARWVSSTQNTYRAALIEICSQIKRLTLLNDPLN